MTSRCCFVLLLLPIILGTIALPGCDEVPFAGPINYRDHERMARDLVDKPKLQETIRKSLAKLYGANLQQIRLPEDSGLRDGGAYLANFIVDGSKREPSTEADPVTGKPLPIAGGYAVYRRYCLQCHGVFGAGDGPTATALYPRPRDYRPGIFKFTSTNPVNAKPSRADLRKTILYGLHGTSMPGFEALMTASEIEQVIDYMTFLSIRGETERYLIDEAVNLDDKDAEAGLGDDLVKEIVAKVTTSWKEAETQVVNPTVRRVPASVESVKRGKELYLGINATGPKLECVGCHGASGRGNGGAFIDTEIFRDAALRFWPLDQAIDRSYQAAKNKAHAGSHDPAPSSKPDLEGLVKFLEANPPVVTLLRKERGLMASVADKDFAETVKASLPRVAEAARTLLPDLDDPDFRAYLVAKMDLWSKSLDAWDNPLRPANLIEGMYKGGRRPIDLYWRIAKGINGAKMPAHASLLTEEQIWDVVNFVLAVVDDPALLPESLPTPIAPPSAEHAVATSP